jgi:hypothetical protein
MPIVCQQTKSSVAQITAVEIKNIVMDFHNEGAEDSGSLAAHITML